MNPLRIESVTFFVDWRWQPQVRWPCSRHSPLPKSH